ncbi:hypothetical protein [Clostridium weizhouense]|uniref:Uncharacterized protein n=1 Tax=Clostridium weizhouense TaxID=2859781 RepID=A0ABS7AJ63_9CLOT|nr:hypothetical protein [Clostridium weizhouense]MBW6408708.1 hypothetical protein [Clostridium weizhouense]
MKNFITVLKTDKYLSFAIVSSIIVILAILILVFEPFNEIPFIYNQF